MRYSVKNFTLLSLVRIALKHIFLLIAAAVIFGAVVFGYFEFLVDPRYSATSSILVTNGALIVDKDGTYDSNSFENADIVASINIANTVCDILETNNVFKSLAEEYDNKYTYRQLRGMATVEKRDSNSLFIDVSFTTGDPELSKELANAYLKIAPDHITGYFPSASTATNEAEDASKVFPNSFVFAFAAAVFGAALTFVIILLVYSSNTVIQDEEDFNERFNVPVLGSVPDFGSARSSKSYYKKYGYSGYGYSKYGYLKYGYGYSYSNNNSNKGDNKNGN